MRFSLRLESVAPEDVARVLRHLADEFDAGELDPTEPGRLADEAGETAGAWSVSEEL